MPDLKKRPFIQLFGYEVYGGRNAVLWKDTSTFFGASGAPPYKGSTVPSGGIAKDPQYEQPFTQWQQQKRDFTKEEIPGCYSKLGDNGQSFLTWFFEEGTLREKHLFQQTEEWGGTWELENGILKTKIGTHVLFIVASKEAHIHGAIQTKQDLNYFKLIRIEQ